MNLQSIAAAYNSKTNELLAWSVNPELVRLHLKDRPAGIAYCMQYLEISDFDDFPFDKWVA